MGVRKEVVDGAEILSEEVQQEEVARSAIPRTTYRTVVLPVKPALNRPLFLLHILSFFEVIFILLMKISSDYRATMSRPFLLHIAHTPIH